MIDLCQTVVQRELLNDGIKLVGRVFYFILFFNPQKQNLREQAVYERSSWMTPPAEGKGPVGTAPSGPCFVLLAHGLDAHRISFIRTATRPGDRRKQPGGQDALQHHRPIRLLGETCHGTWMKG